MNNEVAFKLDTYRFQKASLNFDIPSKAELSINFMPSGKFYKKENRYELSFDVLVTCKDTNSTVISVSCIASFTFTSEVTILFPYIRAFVSTISLQANVSPIILPTVNLMGLTGKLRKNTSINEG